MNTLSKDYKKLYELLCDGDKVTGFLTTEKGKKSSESDCRDICNINRIKEWQITFSLKDRVFSQVSHINSVMGYHTEEEAFILICEELNIEFIEHQNAIYAAIFESEAAELDFKEILEAKGELVVDLRFIEIEALGLNAKRICKLIIGSYLAIPDKAKDCVLFIGGKKQAEKLLSYAGEHRQKISKNPSLAHLIA